MSADHKPDNPLQRLSPRRDQGSDASPSAGRHLPVLASAVPSESMLTASLRPPAGEDEPTAVLVDYLRVLMRRRWLIASVTATVVVLALLQVLTTTPLYQATVTLQIDPEETKVLPYEEIARDGGGQVRQEEYLWTQAQKLRTRELAQRVVRRLDLANRPGFTEGPRRGILIDSLGGTLDLARSLFRRSPEAAAGPRESVVVDNFSYSLRVQLMRNTRLIKVGYVLRDPELAAEIANVVAEEFIELHLEGKFNATIRATEFLHKQIEDLKTRVEESEAALLRYAQEKNIVNLNPQQQISQKRLEDTNTELNRIQQELVAQTVRYEALNQVRPDAAFPEVLKTQKIQDLELRLGSFQGELTGLSERYGSEWPAVKELRLKIGDLERQLAQEKRQAMDAVRAEYRLVRARYDRLARVLDEQRTMADRINEDSIEYRVLKREAESNKELYEGLLQRLKEAGVAAGLRSSNIRVVDAASPPRFAASPHKTRAMMMGLLIGVLLGVLAAFGAETFDNTVKSVDDVATYVGLTPLGVIPSLPGNGGNGNGRLARLLGKKEPPRRRPPILVHEQGKGANSRAWEAYRSLRTSLLLSHSGKPPQVILVTSALPGEGKTTTAANTAFALAQTGARTVVVDLDLRRPAIAKAFRIPSGSGMSTYLSGQSDLGTQVRQTRWPNLYVVGAGPVPPNPPELLGSERMTQSFALLREYFNYVVVDTPPALELSDARILAGGTDGVILVARSGRTPHPALRRASEQLQRVGATVLGVLLNDVDAHSAGYGYYGDYYQNYYLSGPEENGGKRRLAAGASTRGTSGRKRRQRTRPRNTPRNGAS